MRPGMPVAAPKNGCFFRCGMVQLPYMSNTVSALDEYFMANYSDYVRLAALKGYEMPEMSVTGRDGGVTKKDPSAMRLAFQKNREELLSLLKEEQADCDYTFNFRFLTFSEKIRRPFKKFTFARVFRGILAGCRLTAEEAGERLKVGPRFWKKIVKGTLLPEKNTVLALALVCGFTAEDTEKLFGACGYGFDGKSVRDVVVRFLLERKVFSRELVFECLGEYKITCLPIK